MNHKVRAKKLSLVRGEHTLVAGVDIAKKTHWASLADGPAELPVGSPFAFQNTSEGCVRLVDQLRKAAGRIGATRIVVGMEPSGHYWRALAAFLLGQGITVVRRNGRSSSRQLQRARLGSNTAWGLHVYGSVSIWPK